MTTINYKGRELTIVYIDPSISSAGDGSTHTSALKDLPSTFAEGTCYLMRRTSEDYTCIRADGSTTVSSFVLMGMPKSTDENYSLITDEAVKTDWADENYEYANIKFTNGSTFFIISSAGLVDLSRIYCFRDGVSTESNISHMFEIRSTLPKINISHSKFGTKGYDFEKDEYLNNDNRTYSVSRAYVRTYNMHAEEFNMKDVIVNYYPYHYDSNTETHFTRGHGFFVRAKNVNLESVIVNASYYDDSSKNNCYCSRNQNNACCLSNIFSGDSTALFVDNVPQSFRLRNCTFNSIMSDTKSIPSYPLYVNCGDNVCNFANNASYYYTVANNKCFVDVDGITYNIKAIKNAKPQISYNSSYDSRYAPSQAEWVGSIYFYGGIRGLIKNITANCDIEGAKQYAQTILTIESRVFEKSKSPLLKVENFTAKYAKTIDESKSYFSDWVDRPSIYVMANNPAAYETSTPKNVKRMDLNNVVELKNINIDCPLGESVNLRSSIIKDSNLVGKVILDGYTTVDIPYLQNSNLSDKSISITSNDPNEVYVENLIVDFDNGHNKFTGSAQIDYDKELKYYGNSNILVKKSNAVLFKSTDELPTNINTLSQLACPNYGAEGQYYQTSSVGKIVSYNVRREGSTAEASLGFDIQGTPKDFATLNIGSDTYSGINKTVATSGEKTLTFYVCSVSEIDNDELKKLFNIKVSVPTTVSEGSTSFKKDIIVESKDVATVSDDASTWSMINDAICKKITMPITVTDNNTLLDIKVENALTTMSTLYFDPDVKIA